MKKIILVVLALVLPISAFATGSARTLYGNQIKNAAQTVTNTLPTSSGTILNTVSTNVPVAASLVQEVPSGTCNGSTTVFTLANTPGGSASVMIFEDGLILTQGAGKDYTISGASITLAAACASGQTLYAVYSKF